ncbi:cyanase [Rhodovibrio salinarum]|uniref:Cyanate hydratase n=2 Tax=Rhodovibrio salinarum TaxID=1087 RepID=A0A934V135_9PROT|nr:cyanase [Rhodovibrio salinarum]
MTKDDVAAMVLAAKKKSGMTWEGLAETLGMSPVWTHAACMGMVSMPEEQARTLVRTCDLPEEAVSVLAECPTKTWDQTVPTDPCIYRLYEIMGVYGASMKALIHEKFGDGIMSAIDFEMYVNRKQDPKGDRVEVVMSGKFLPYRTW